jgi:signal transduction histidine kinase
LIRTFDALLSIARLEAGAAAGARERFSLNAVVSGVCELYEPVAEESGMTLVQSEAPDIEIEGERQLVAQAVANLVDNAIKYGGRGRGDAKPDITVSLEPIGAYVDIVVADRGPGIPAADRDRAVKRFVRLEASRSRPGSGLGLSLAAAVARLHGGRIALASNEPGLKVILSLKRGDGPAARA